MDFACWIADFMAEDFDIVGWRNVAHHHGEDLVGFFCLL